VHGHSGSCSLYATQSNFGLYCLGGGGGSSQTVKEFLGAEKLPNCWDDPMSAAQLAQYDLQPSDQYGYYLQSCLSGIDPNRPMSSQPGVQLNQSVIELPRHPPVCASPQPEPKWGTCRMTLTDRQRRLVRFSTPRDAQIPGIVLLIRPSGRARVNQDVAFVDGNAVTATEQLNVGGVTMWAQLDGFAIYPFGPDGQRVPCAGTQDVAATDTPASKPQACWWRYARSSATQPGERYPFRAEATWNVYVRDGQGQRVFATFLKWDDLALPVTEIQTVVVN